MKEKIAIQGIEGSFHHQVAQECFGKTAELKKCMSFEEVAQSLQNSEAGVGIMAIENSIAGAIFPNFQLVDKYELEITGEYYLPVQMNLLAVPGQKIEDVKRVFSHPMALLQCRDYFRNFPEIELVDDADTASVAKRISEEGTKNVAAVASKTAAELFGLQVLAENIHNRETNTTRFFVLRSKQERLLNANKATLKLTAEKEADISAFLELQEKLDLELLDLHKNKLNRGRELFAELLFRDQEQLQQALKLMQPKLKLLGMYRNRLPQHLQEKPMFTKAKAV